MWRAAAAPLRLAATFIPLRKVVLVRAWAHSINTTAGAMAIM